MLKEKECTRLVKDYALEAGADLIGIAPIERFEEAPPAWHPETIFPGVKSVVVLGFRILRGCYRGMDERTFFQSYSTYGYGWINYAIAPTIVRNVAIFLEDRGYEAVPVPEYTSARGFGRPSEPDEPAPEVFLHLRMAAVAAGLGERGYSGIFLSPQFGP